MAIILNTELSVSFLTMQELEKIGTEYYALLNHQQFNAGGLDYTIFEKQKPMLQQLARIGNSGVTVFDLHTKKLIFTSYNFSSLFGFQLNEKNDNGNEYYNARIHPQDSLALTQNAIFLLKFFYQLPMEERGCYKLICEYRMLNAAEKFIRVIEQNQVLELDKDGNVWLALGVIDVSPDQEDGAGIKSQLLNYKTGKLVSFVSANEIHRLTTDLTKREKEVLQLVKEGLFSKEISERLSISVHTVNTHRQRILEKLEADNAMEAVDYATQLGLLK